jgi:hypothetical protein
MVCDINRSISIGILTTIVMAVIILFWIGIENIKNSNVNIINIIFFVCVLFVISTSMDYFNQCYTTCDNVKSSILYSVFAVTMIYLFYSLFVNPFQLTTNNMLMYGSNIVIIGLLHYFTCQIDRRD